jgi:RNA recognition motif-containing protein
VAAARGGRGGCRPHSPPLPSTPTSMHLHHSPDDVRTMFAAHGEVDDVYLPREPGSSRPRGFGFVSFRSPAAAEAAVAALDGTQVGGRAVEVAFSKQKRKTADEMIRRDGPPRGWGGGGGACLVWRQPPGRSVGGKSGARLSRLSSLAAALRLVSVRRLPAPSKISNQPAPATRSSAAVSAA